MKFSLLLIKYTTNKKMRILLKKYDKL